MQNVDTVRPANRKPALTLATPDLDRSLLGGIVVLTASELGVAAAVLRFRDLTTDQIGQFNGLSIVAGGLGLHRHVLK